MFCLLFLQSIIKLKIKRKRERENKRDKRIIKLNNVITFFIRKNFDFN